MNRDEIIKEFTDKEKHFEALALNLTGGENRGLFNECSKILFGLSEEKLISDYIKKDGLERLFTCILIDQHSIAYSTY